MDGKYVITIGREFGSGGRQIGHRLAELLNIAYYDKELIEEASRRSGVSRDFIARADEKAPLLLAYAFLSASASENILGSGHF